MARGATPSASIVLETGSSVKYLLVLLVVGVGIWMLVKRLGSGGGSGGSAGGSSGGESPGGSERASPVAMVECAHCGVHLPAADAVPEGSRVYCSEAHRRLGPSPTPPA
jgi:uncharacterized protein